MIITVNDLKKLNACSSAIKVMHRKNGRAELIVANCQWFIDNFIDEDNFEWSSWKSIGHWLTKDIYGIVFVNFDYDNIYFCLMDISKRKRAPLLCSLLIDKLEEMK